MLVIFYLSRRTLTSWTPGIFNNDWFARSIAILEGWTSLVRWSSTAWTTFTWYDVGFDLAAFAHCGVTRDVTIVACAINAGTFVPFFTAKSWNTGIVDTGIRKFWIVGTSPGIIIYKKLNHFLCHCHISLYYKKISLPPCQESRG